MKVHFSFQIVAGIMETDPEAQGSGRVKSEVILIMEFFLAVQNSSIVAELNRWPCPLVGLSITTNNQGLHNTTEWA